MRIAYLISLDVGHESGVLKKIRAQLRAWRRAGHTTRLFACSPTTTPWEGLEQEPVSIVPNGPRIAGPYRFFQLARRARAWAPDVVYLRFSTWKPALEWLANAVPVVAEINTRDLDEYKLFFSRPGFELHRRTRPRMLRRVAGAVALTHELGADLRADNVPYVVIANGIDLDGFEAARRESTPPDPAAATPEPPRLVFLGSAGFPWHGVDEIAALARTLPDWRFDIVGIEADELGSAPPDNVTLHGHLSQEGYRSLLVRADAAIGTMALYRKNMEEACALKVREYLGAGLPVVLACRDTDFLDPSPFLLELPNQPGSAVEHRDKIVAFVESWRGRRVPRAGVQHLDVSAKETERLAAMERFRTAWRKRER